MEKINLNKIPKELLLKIILNGSDSFSLFNSAKECTEYFDSIKQKYQQQLEKYKNREIQKFISKIQHLLDQFENIKIKMSCYRSDEKTSFIIVIYYQDFYLKISQYEGKLLCCFYDESGCSLIYTRRGNYNFLRHYDGKVIQKLETAFDNEDFLKIFSEINFEEIFPEYSDFPQTTCIYPFSK